MYRSIRSRSLSLLSSLALLALPWAGCDGTTMTPNQNTDMSQSGPVARLVVAGSDFTTGSLSTVRLGDLAVRPKIDVVDAQPIVRAYGGKVYVLDQTHGSVRVYDPAGDFQQPSDFPTEKLPDLQGADSNPHDLFVDVGRQLAYVSLYGAAGKSSVTAARALGVIDLKSPKAGITKFIPLTVGVKDADNNPEADRMVGCGDFLYVLLQDLDRNAGYDATAPGRLAVIDLRDTSKVGYIALAGQNPTGLAVLPDCKEAIVGTADAQYSGMQNGKGGIERVDLATQKSQGFALTDTALGANVSGLDARDLHYVFVDLLSKSDATTYNHDVFVVDLIARSKPARVLGPMNYVAAVRVLGASQPGTLVVLSAGTPKGAQLKTGLYLGAADGKALATQPLDVGLPPVSVDFIDK